VLTSEGLYGHFLRTNEMTVHMSITGIRNWVTTTKCRQIILLVVFTATAGCGDSRPPTSASPNSNTVTVRIVFQGATTRRSDLPVSAQSCANSVGVTHTHPSWRGFAGIPLQPVPPDRYEITFNDVPVGTQVSFRVNDQNFCDENATGAVTRNVFANDVRLIQNATTPGSGPEPGFAMTVSASGAVTQ
jgi:hypothetical protein